MSTPTSREHTITLIPGDGIGPEITRVVTRILAATGVKIRWEESLAGAEAYERYKEYIPKELYLSIDRNRVALKGPVTTPIGGGFSSINVMLRKHYELYANYRPIKNLPFRPRRVSVTCALRKSCTAPDGCDRQRRSRRCAAA